MTTTYQVLESLAALTAASARWNDLWQRSSVETPMARAEGIELWFRHLTRASRFRAVVVEHNGEWAAALPVILENRGLIRIARLPWHPWSPGGTLIADPQLPPDMLAEGLIDGLRSLGATLGWFDEIAGEAPEWVALRQALERRGCRSRLETRYGIGQVVVTDSWDWYESHLPKNHRRNQRKALTKLEKQGSVEFRSLDRFANGDWQGPFERFVQIEDSSWKGAAGSSIARDPAMYRFFSELAAIFAEGGALELLQLQHEGEPIAAELGYRAKGTYFSHKVGYDPRYAEFSPGNLLMYLQLQQYHATRSHQKLDAISEISPTMARWANRIELRHRLQVSLSGRVGNQLTGALEIAARSVRRLRRSEPWQMPELPAAASLVEMPLASG